MNNTKTKNKNICLKLKNQNEKAMKTIELSIYTFAELSPEAQQTAIDNYRNKGIDTSWIYDDAYQSVKAFHEVFGTAEGYRSWLDVRTGHIVDAILELKGLRLRTYLINNFGSQIYTPKYLRTGGNRTKAPTRGHRMIRVKKISHGPDKGLFYVTYYSSLKRTSDCPLTGVCYDYNLLNPFTDFIDKYREVTHAESTTFKDLIEEAISNLKMDLEDEEENMNSDEYIREELENQDYEYTEDGEQF